MKHVSHAVLIAILTVSANSAFAAKESGKITFNGQVTEATCKLSVIDTGNNNNSGAKTYDKDGTVFLPTTLKSSLLALDSTKPGAGPERFQIKVDCTGSGVADDAAVTLALSSPVQDTQGTLKNTYQGNAVAAENVSIAIHQADAQTNQVVVGSTQLASKFKDEMALFDLQASYILAQGKDLASAKAGLVDTMTQYTVEYQ
ncbi:hypothetical protein [Enterobacter sp.]|uniref:hypothetical protein n=1 Tax=Enterobacter sp. TaxID=42895 RepID=UPI00296E6000|nr:hypothetical protein [Enterobacter sp.]